MTFRDKSLSIYVMSTENSSSKALPVAEQDLLKKPMFVPFPFICYYSSVLTPPLSGPPRKAGAWMTLKSVVHWERVNLVILC